MKAAVLSKRRETALKNKRRYHSRKGGAFDRMGKNNTSLHTLQIIGLKTGGASE